MFDTIWVNRNRAVMDWCVPWIFTHATEIILVFHYDVWITFDSFCTTITVISQKDWSKFIRSYVKLSDFVILHHLHYKINGTWLRRKELGNCKNLFLWLVTPLKYVKCTESICLFIWKCVAQLSRFWANYLSC